MTTKGAKASSGVEPPKRRKNASKKNKKSWRKNTDIDDVDEFLEDQRLEQRLGGSFDQRQDDELFVVDKGVKESGKALAQPISRRAARKKAAKEKPFKCFQSLLPDVEVAPHVTPGTRRNPVLVAKEKKLKEKGVVKAKERIAKKHKAQAAVTVAANNKAQETRRRTDFDFDLWNEDVTSAVGANEVKSSEWLGEDTKVHTLLYTRKKAVRAPGKAKARTKLAAVETPAGGESYNPSFKDHQDILFRATLTELKKERVQNNVDFHTTRMFPARPPTDAERVKELTEGLFDDKEEEPSNEKAEETGDEKSAKGDDVDDDDDDKEKKGNKPKTRKQKRDERKRRVQELKADKVKRDKVLEHDFTRLKSIKKALAAEEDEVEANKVKKAKTKEEKLTKAATLSNYKFEEPEVDIKLSEELTGNLRNLKPEGNILTDRFKSLQKRNLIETRVKQKIKKKARNKRIVEKRNHKMGFDWEK